MAVNESNTIQYTVTTTNTADGTTLYWRTTGNTTNSDITGGNTGTITVTNNRALFNVTLIADANTDGPKTLGMILSTTQGGPGVITSSTILINDTSLTPSYSFSSVPSSINEGSAGTFSVSSTAADGTTAYWTINNVSSTSADFSANSGSFTITGGAASFTITPFADSTTEGSETFTVSLRTGSISGTVQNTSSSVTINDTSLSPVNRLYLIGTMQYGSSGLNVGSIYKSSPTQVGSDTNWTEISNGNISKLAIKNDGTLWAWGYNQSGSLGLNTTGGYSTFRKYSSPTQVGALTNWNKVHIAEEVTLAVKTDGTLWSWGYMQNSQSGNGTSSVQRSSPAQVGALTNWSSVVHGGLTPTAIKTDGTLWTWGYGSNGLLGRSNNSDNASPVQVGTDTNWSKAFAGYAQTAAIKTDGTLWLWGAGTYGVMGQNNTQSYSSPAQVGTGTNWSQAAFGKNGCAAIKTDGTLWTWGHNQEGQLGLNNTVYNGGNKSSPTQVGAGTNWLKITGGYGFFMATKTDNTLWFWGKNNGQAGTNNQVSYSSPVQVGTNTNWDKISCFNRSGIAGGGTASQSMMTTK